MVVKVNNTLISIDFTGDFLIRELLTGHYDKWQITNISFRPLNIIHEIEG